MYGPSKRLRRGGDQRQHSLLAQNNAFIYVYGQRRHAYCMSTWGFYNERIRLSQFALLNVVAYQQAANRGQIRHFSI